MLFHPDTSSSLRYRTSCGHASITTREFSGTVVADIEIHIHFSFSSLEKKDVEGFLDLLDAQIFCFQGMMPVFHQNQT
jgi:hypothetical protein